MMFPGADFQSILLATGPLGRFCLGKVKREVIPPVLSGSVPKVLKAHTLAAWQVCRWPEN